MKALRALGIALGYTAIALAAWGLGWLDPWEARTWDWRASAMATGKADPRVAMILLDQASLDWAQEEMSISWPWPRELYAAMLAYLKDQGAAAAAFDVLYTEPSKYGLEDDLAFARAAADFGPFVGALFVGESTGKETSWPEGFPRPCPDIAGISGWLKAHPKARVQFPRASLPVRELAQSAGLLANVHLNPDEDGVYRRARLLSVFDGRAVPSLGLGAYLSAHPDAPVALESDSLTVGEASIPLDENLCAILRFRGPAGTFPAYSAAAVLQSHIRRISGQKPTITNPDAFSGKYVLFGFSAPGLFDLRSAPTGGVYPGVEIHATMLDNLLNNDFMREAPAWMVVLAVFAAALIAATGATFWARPPFSIVVFSAALALPAGASLAAYAGGVWLPLVAMEAAAAMAILSSITMNYAFEGRQRQFIKDAFGQYLSPAVVEQLIAHPEKLNLGGERKTLSIFFSDLEGFTSISEGMEPEELTALLNDYLSAMTDIIHEHGGTVDKYEGDAIIAFWNAPVDVKDHAARMVKSALECQAKLAELRPSFRERTGHALFMRIGMNTGPAVVGNLGSKTRFDYTMLGDAVNLAARLEGANKQFGTYTMISDSTKQQLGEEIATRRLARLAVVGKKLPVLVHEPMTRGQYKERKPVLQAFERALDLFFEGKFSEAEQGFLALADQDPPSAAYVKKCRRLAADPPQDWQGVWVMTSK